MKKAKYLFLILFISLIAITPVISLADDSDTQEMFPNTATGSCSSINSFAKFVGCIQSVILQPLIYLLFALAIVYFLYGVLTYVRKGGDEDDRRAGKDMMIYGIIALAVMVSVYGLVNLVTNTFNLETNQPTPPVFSN